MNNIVEKQKMMLAILPGMKSESIELIKRYIDTAYQAGVIDGKIEELEKSITSMHQLLETK